MVSSVSSAVPSGSLSVCLCVCVPCAAHPRAAVCSCVCPLRLCARVCDCVPGVVQLLFVHNPLAIEIIGSIGHQPPRDFGRLFPSASPLALDLLVRMLQFDPARRITVAEAICHPYIKEYHDWDAANEPVRFWWWWWWWWWCVCAGEGGGEGGMTCRGA